ncbi:MAG: patatin family protein [Prevotellaceae bacterium]|nr:patatin family protein [Prevotellaceae bacterium]
MGHDDDILSHQKPKRGLVLEGGGMRAMFTAGVMDVMMEARVPLDGIVGVSAGAAFGVNYKSGQAGRVARYNPRFAPEARYMGVRSFLTTGNFMNAEFCYHTVPTRYDVFAFDAYERDPMEYYVVCTDVVRGVPVYRRLPRLDYEGIEWIRASGSLPIISKPVRLQGGLYLDGGLTDSIPLRFFQQLGYGRCVVILTQPRGFLKRRTRLMPLFHVLMRRHPRVISLMRHRHRMYNRQLKFIHEQEILGRALIVCPDREIDVSRVSQRPRELRQVYETGRRKGEERLPEIKAFLGLGVLEAPQKR